MGNEKGEILGSRVWFFFDILYKQNSLKFLRGRSLSFRLYKSKSTPIGSEAADAPPEQEDEKASSKDKKVGKKDKSGKFGLISGLLSLYLWPHELSLCLSR